MQMQAQAAKKEEGGTDELAAIAGEAYTFLYPLVMMEVTRRHSLMQFGSSMNTWIHLRQYPPSSFRGVVRPNFDTLYSIAWLDLTQGPVVIGVPDTAGRYFCVPLYDMWTDCFAVPGSRTTGTSASRFCIVGPSGGCDQMSGANRIQSPTPYVWVILRIMTNGESDYEAVHRLQDQLTLSTVDGSVPPQARPPAMTAKGAPLHVVSRMRALDFFDFAAPLLDLHPPHLSDGSMVLRLGRLGLSPGKAASFSSKSLDSDAERRFERGVASALLGFDRQKAPAENGWVFMSDTIGVYGNSYQARAYIAKAGLGALPCEDAMYISFDGATLQADSPHIIRFEKGSLPPCDAFWSATLYDESGFPVANPIGRHAVGSLHGLEFEADGSLEILVARDQPRSKLSNWLPAGEKGRRSLTLRIYAPRAELLQGKWKPPSVVPVGASSKL